LPFRKLNSISSEQFGERARVRLPRSLKTLNMFIRTSERRDGSFTHGT
jgi:hypothetical protein